MYVVKAGYPPRALTAVIPELPLSSLGLAPGDQLIVVQKSGSAAPPGVTSAAPTSSSPVNPAYPDHTPAVARPTLSSNPRPAAPTRSTTTEDGGPDHVAMDGGYLIHRVRAMNYVVLIFEGNSQYLLLLFLCRSCQMIIRVCLHLSRSFLSRTCERRP